MKNIFRNYYNSTLHPGDFSKFTKIVLDKRNEKFVFSEMKPLWDNNLLENSDLPVPNKMLIKKIKESIFINERKNAQRKLKLYSYGLKIAAVLIIGLIINMVFFIQPKEQSNYSAQLMTINIPFGAKTSTTLPDGSKVWLNSGSTLTYPSVFDDERPVTLTGEAFFEVVKSKSPFIVATSYGEVEVKGTSFNVKAFIDDNSFETTLVEGSVIVRDKNQINEVTLQPGQQTMQSQDGFKINYVETEHYTSWKEGKLIFSKEPFPSFIKKLERWYNVKIEYNDLELNELWYTGTIEMESISEVMIMISKAAPVSYNFDSKTRIFTINAELN